MRSIFPVDTRLRFNVDTTSCAYWVGGEQIGFYENGELHKGIIHSQGTDLIFYISERALIREGGAFMKAGELFQIITVMLPGLEMSYLNALMLDARIELEQSTFNFTFKINLNCLHPRNTKKRDKNLPSVQL